MIDLSPGRYPITSLKRGPGGITTFRISHSLTALKDGILFHHRLTRREIHMCSAHRSFLPGQNHSMRHGRDAGMIDRNEFCTNGPIVWEGMCSMRSSVATGTAIYSRIDLDPEGTDVNNGKSRSIALHRLGPGQTPCTAVILSRGNTGRSGGRLQ